MDVPAFETDLIDLVDEARSDGVSVAGAYDVRTPRPDEPDYTVEITEVSKRRYPWTERS